MRELTSKDASYEGVVNSFGVKVLLSQYVGYYQGDILYLLKDKSKYGFLSIGYGSCSGCDYMEGLVGYGEEITDNVLAELTAFRDNLWKLITWRTRKEMVEFFEKKDFALEWYGHEDGTDEFLKNAKEAVAKKEK